MPRPGEREGAEETRKRVDRMAEELKAEGYVFDLEESSSQFIIRVSGTEVHVTKWEKIPLDLDGDGKPEQTQLIEDYIRERIKELTGNDKGKKGS